MTILIEVQGHSASCAQIWGAEDALCVFILHSYLSVYVFLFLLLIYLSIQVRLGNPRHIPTLRQALRMHAFVLEAF